MSGLSPVFVFWIPLAASVAGFVLHWTWTAGVLVLIGAVLIWVNLTSPFNISKRVGAPPWRTLDLRLEGPGAPKLWQNMAFGLVLAAVQLGVAYLIWTRG